MGLTMLFVGEMWKTLGIWTRNVVGCFNHGLMGHPSRGTEDNGAKHNVDDTGPVQEVSGGRALVSGTEIVPRIRLWCNRGFCLLWCVEYPQKKPTHNSPFAFDNSLFIHHYNKVIGHSGLKGKGLISAHGLKGYNPSWQRT